MSGTAQYAFSRHTRARESRTQDRRFRDCFFLLIRWRVWSRTLSFVAWRRSIAAWPHAPWWGPRVQ